ncbi:MAG TPA: hypothetical protein VF015_11890 [Acidimicrobiales bacterium]
MAPLAIVGAVGLAACGDEAASDSTRTAGVASVAAANGSDRHLQNQAESIAASVRGQRADSARLTAEAEAYESRTPAAIVVGSDVHLANQATEIAERTAPVGSDVHLANQAAEIAERQDKLDNAAETYGQETPEPSNDEFVPGTRRMPVR